MWSAGCSNGQEAYSIVMEALERFPELATMDFKVLATDIDPKVVEFAKNGVYPKRLTSGIPAALLNKYFSESNEKYDIIFDTVGKSSYSKCIKSLKKNGQLHMASAGLFQMLQGLWTSITSSKKVISGVIKETAEDMDYIKQLIENGHLKAVIDRSYPLEQAVEAHRYVDKGHKKGNVILTVKHNDK